MTPPAALAIVIQSTALAVGLFPSPGGAPHPAVVRVVAHDSDGVSYGSGTLVAVTGQHGLVVTNWHVVRDATGAISVVFPDGFRSAARVLRVDRDWDLAALLIWRPPVAPIPLARRAPQPGESLTIAGYGSGSFRAVTGRCTQYVAPGRGHPFEMVEVAARARQGDSGGPILNAEGELAGVLFGSGGGTTSGSYAGRVQRFLSTAWPPPSAPVETSTLAAASPEASPHNPTRQATASLQAQPGNNTARLTPLPPSAAPTERSGAPATESVTQADRTAPNAASAPATTTTTFTWEDLAGETLLQQAKTFLALLGLFTLLAHAMRILSAPRGE